MTFLSSVYRFLMLYICLKFDDYLSDLKHFSSRAELNDNLMADALVTALLVSSPCMSYSQA